MSSILFGVFFYVLFHCVKKEKIVHFWSVFISKLNVLKIKIKKEIISVDH